MKRDELIRLLQSMPENVDVVMNREDFLHHVKGVELVKGTAWGDKFAESFYPEIDAEEEKVYTLIALRPYEV